MENVNDELPDLSITLPRMRDVDPTLKEWINVVLPIDFLLLTVKDCEFLSCYHYLQNPFQSYLYGLGFVIFGDMGETNVPKVKVALMRCDEAAADPRGSLIAVKNAVTELRPKAVFFVGFAGALNHDKVKLGDVVISAKLTMYAPKNVTNNGVQPRGLSTPASRHISDLIKYSGFGWKAPMKNPEVRDVKVHSDGEFLSGPELVNSGWRREELLELYPNAIAIEMGGEGVFSAAFDLQIEWVIIKGISNYADGTKTATNKWRPFASAMAASVVAKMLRNPSVFQDWPHHNQSPSTSTAGRMRPREEPSPHVSGSHQQGSGDLGNLLGGVMQALNVTGTSGQLVYKGRDIAYRAHGRIHSLEEPWVYDGLAWDIESGISTKKHHYKEPEEAINHAVNELITRLKDQGKLSN